MGKSISTIAGEDQVEHASESNTHDEPIMDSFHRIDKSRWAELMGSLQSIANLQGAATTACVDARQKRREAKFKREDVWFWDDKFMGEIQRLNIQGKLQGFEELSRLAAECQKSRDLVGPLEQESIEAEYRWQGQIWTLEEAEEDLYAEFKDEFRDAAEYFNAHDGEASSTQPPSDSDSQPSVKDENTRTDVATLPIITSENNPEVENPLSLELMHGDVQHFGDAVSESDLDSGFGDIDAVLESSPRQANNYGLPKALPKRRSSGIEIYHKLLENFSTRRERVNKWLENNALESRLESLSLYSILQDLLAIENQEVPSNWANLVVAYWDLDEASLPALELVHHEQGHRTAIKECTTTQL